MSFVSYNVTNTFSLLLSRKPVRQLTVSRVFLCILYRCRFNRVISKLRLVSWHYTLNLGCFSPVDRYNLKRHFMRISWNWIGKFAHVRNEFSPTGCFHYHSGTISGTRTFITAAVWIKGPIVLLIKLSQGSALPNVIKQPLLAANVSWKAYCSE